MLNPLPASHYEEIILSEHEVYEQQDVCMTEREYSDELINVAIVLLENSHPIPVDMTAQLLEEGVDVDALLSNYG